MATCVLGETLVHQQWHSSSGWSDVFMPDIWRFYLSPSQRLREEWKRKVRCHALFGTVVSFGTVWQWRWAYAFVLYGRRGSSGPPLEKFDRICAELWYSGPTWTKNSAYRTVPFLDFWVLEWYWNYNQLFWKLMKGIRCWIVGCIPSEWFELTQNFF